MAKTKIQETQAVTEEENEVYGNVYQMWIEINNQSAGEIKVEIRQYGKPPPGDPPPGGG